MDHLRLDQVVMQDGQVMTMADGSHRTMEEGETMTIAGSVPEMSDQAFKERMEDEENRDQM